MKLISTDFNEWQSMRSMKHNARKWWEFDADVLPSWIAELDFPIADPIRHALKEATEASDLGYPIPVHGTKVPDIVCRRMFEMFGWQITPPQVGVVGDVNQALYVAVSQLTAYGDGVITFTPGYPPLLGCIRELGRRPIEVPLVDSATGFRIDFDLLKRQLDKSTRLMLLCNPHNPTGRVFTQAELTILSEFAIENGLFIISDEIHQDIVYSGHHHIPIASLSEEIGARTITLTSATKAFNLAGVGCAVVLFGSQELRDSFNAFPSRFLGQVSTLSLIALHMAWDHPECREWQKHTMHLLEQQRNILVDFLARQTEGVHVHPPEGTYLTWCNCQALGLKPDPYQYFLRYAKVAFGAGSNFGDRSREFVRVNFGTSANILDEILRRVRQSLSA